MIDETPRYDDEQEALFLRQNIIGKPITAVEVDPEGAFLEFDGRHGLSLSPGPDAVDPVNFKELAGKIVDEAKIYPGLGIMFRAGNVEFAVEEPVIWFKKKEETIQ